MVRTLRCTVWLIALIVPMTLAARQTPAAAPAPSSQAPAAASSAGTPAAPAFEVAEITPSPDIATIVATHQMPNVGVHVDGARVSIGFTSLAQLIIRAYDVKPYQIEGPDWLTSTRFDIQATLPQDATQDDVPRMLQTLLATRFHLALHHKTESLPVYALVVGSGGPKLAPAVPPSAAPAPPPAPGQQTIDTGNGGTASVGRGADGSATITVANGPNGPMRIVMSADNGMQLEADDLTMAALAETMTPFLDRPVLDMTGLAGAFSIKLAISPQDLRAMMLANAAKAGIPASMMMGMAGGANAGAAGSGPVSTPDPSGSSVFNSVQKLGLKLDPRKAPVDCLVIDRIDKTPTAN